MSSGEVSTPSLRTLCPTRWTVRHASILLNYKVLLTALEEIRQSLTIFMIKLLSNPLH